MSEICSALPDSLCPVCGEALVKLEKTWSEYRGDPTHMILGPGFKDQCTTVYRCDIYCERCGIQFFKLPEKRS